MSAEFLNQYPEDIKKSIVSFVKNYQYPGSILKNLYIHINRKFPDWYENNDYPDNNIRVMLQHLSIPINFKNGSMTINDTRFKYLKNFMNDKKLWYISRGIYKIIEKKDLKKLKITIINNNVIEISFNKNTKFQYQKINKNLSNPTLNIEVNPTLNIEDNPTLNIEVNPTLNIEDNIILTCQKIKDLLNDITL